MSFTLSSFSFLSRRALELQYGTGKYEIRYEIRNEIRNEIRKLVLLHGRGLWVLVTGSSILVYTRVGLVLMFVDVGVLGGYAIHRCRNATRSAVHESGATPSLTTSRHLLSTPHISLCRPVNRLPPNAAFFEAIFW